MEIIQEISAERALKHFPIEKEEIISTMDKPVIIESACPGWQVGGKRFPAVPCSIEDQVKEIVDSIKAGAVAIHVHPRDPRDCAAKIDSYLLKKVLDPVFDEVGDCVTLPHTWKAAEEADYITDTKELLELGQGNKYCQGSVILPANYTSSTGAFHSEKSIIEGIQWYEAHDVKPIYLLYDTYTIFNLQQKIFSNGISKKRPYVFNVNLGKHHSHAIHKDPWSYLNCIANFNMVKETIKEECVIGVSAGGRNWLPITVLGLLMGAQLFRVGIEDCYWIYPHKNEVIKKNSDMIKLTADIARLLGRRVVTDPKEAREILGIKLTSKL
ncbi:MAG: hypothetical protein A2Z35_04040 [Actinobacteria bacterium RBG_19FT_COMBO_36_27]|nr:MAG: hypothetical protein A2Z35_04040 [Actinobacteria bacterium RBG_19FT_COMBO_36_27]